MDLFSNKNLSIQFRNRIANIKKNIIKDKSLDAVLLILGIELFNIFLKFQPTTL
jgi:hypothetical protein